MKVFYNPSETTFVLMDPSGCGWEAYLKPGEDTPVPDEAVAPRDYVVVLTGKPEIDRGIRKDADDRYRQSQRDISFRMSPQEIDKLEDTTP